MAIGIKKCLASLVLAGVSVPMAFAFEREHSAHQHGHALMTIVVEKDELQAVFEAPSANIVGFEYQPKTDREKHAVASARDLLKNPSNVIVLPAQAHCKLEQVKVESELLSGAANEQKDHAKHAEQDYHYDHDGHESHDDHDHESHDEHGEQGDHLAHAGHDDHDHEGHNEHAHHDEDQHNEKHHDDDADHEHSGHDHSSHDHAEHGQHSEETHSEFKAEYHFECEHMDDLDAVSVYARNVFSTIETLEVQVVSRSGQSLVKLQGDQTRVLLK